MMTLQDRHKRNHNYLRISITEHCNLRCTYCMPEKGVNLSPKSHLMSPDEIVEIAKIFIGLGVTKIRLTGGEPLVRKEAKEIITRLSQLGVELHITSNGLLVDEFIDTFKEAKIKSLNISIDTLNRGKYLQITRRDYFDKLRQNIQLLQNHDFNIRLNVVLMKGFNDDEIIDFIKLTQFQNIQIRFIEFMPFNDNQWDKSKLVSLQEILAICESEYEQINIVRLRDKQNDTAKNYQIKTFTGSFAVISAVTNPFCSTCNRIRLTADGKLKNCLFSNNESDLLTALRQNIDITPLIMSNITLKFKMRGGMDDDVKFQNPSLFSNNRSMIMIGG